MHAHTTDRTGQKGQEGTGRDAMVRDGFCIMRAYSYVGSVFRLFLIGWLVGWLVGGVSK